MIYHPIPKHMHNCMGSSKSTCQKSAHPIPKKTTLSKGEPVLGKVGGCQKTCFRILVDGHCD